LKEYNTHIPNQTSQVQDLECNWNLEVNKKNRKYSKSRIIGA